MKSFFTNSTKKLAQKQLIEIAAFCGGVALLLVVAAGISTGGMQKVNHLLALAHILPDTQTACVFPCNNAAYDMESLTPMQGGVAVSTVQPGTTVYWQYIASSYGANNFTTLCAGTNGGLNVACSVALGAGNVWGSCVNPYYSGGTTCQSWSYTYDKFGNATPSCDYYDTPVYHPGTGCGNADAYIQGDTCFGPAGGIPFNYSCPGYHGNPYGTLPITAPSTPGTYTYYFCSYYLENASSFNGSLTPLPCLGTNLIVASPPPTCTLSSASVYYGQPANLTYSTANASGVTYAIDGVNQGAPAGNPFNTNPSGTLAIGNHNVTMTVTGPGGSGTCGGANYVVINAQPATSCTLSPASQSITNLQSASFTYTNPNANTTTYTVDGGAPITPSGGAFSVSSLSVGTHSVLMSVSNSTNSSTCGVAGNITVTAAPSPVVSLTAGGASSVTVNPNATTTLAWSVSGATPGTASLTAPSNSATVTNLASFSAPGSKPEYYRGQYVTVGGYLYEFGGYNNSAWVNGVWRMPTFLDPSVSTSWTSYGAIMPAAAPVAGDAPLVINGKLYFFGGLNQAASSYVGTICSVPVGSITTTATWDCSGSLPTGGAQDFSQPVIIGDYIYRFGGYNGPTYATSVTSVERAPVSSPTSWTLYPNVLPISWYVNSSVVVGNYVYILSGYTGSAAGTNNIYRAAITSDLTQAASWTSAGVLPRLLYGPTVAVDANNLYVIGGYSSATLTSIYSVPLSTLAAGGLTAGSWSSAAGTLPLGEYSAQSLLIDSKLFLFGGYNETQAAPYVLNVYGAPFNAGKPYTTPANMPWHTDGGNNQAVTWPITVNSVTYTLSATNISGTTVATATVSEPDLCTNAPFTGIQNPLPSGVTAVGTTCTCTTGIWNGSACFVSPVISTPTITPLITGSISAVKRVKKGNAVTLNWNVSGLVIGDTNTSCSVYSFPAAAMTPVTWDRTTTTWTQPVSAPTVTITGPTTFTVSCSNATWGTPTISASAQVNLVPSFQEQ